MKTLTVKISRVAVPANHDIGMIGNIHDRLHVGQFLCFSAVHFKPDFLAIIRAELAKLVQGLADLFNRLLFGDTLMKLVGLDLYASASNVMTQLDQFLAEIHMLLEYCRIRAIKFDVRAVSDERYRAVVETLLHFPALRRCQV